MGLTYANIELVNAGDEGLLRRNLINKEEVRHMTINVIVDKSSVLLCINEDIQKDLGLSYCYKRLAQAADGSKVELDVVGPVIIHYLDRDCSTNAVVLPDNQEPMLGAIPISEMDLYVNFERNELLPVHPDGPIMSLK